MRERVITIKGKGSASAPPDCIEIDMGLEAKEFSYEETINLAAKQLEQLRESIVKEGFKKKDIKTVKFDIDTEYKRDKDKNDNYETIFDGYLCSQILYIEFEADSIKLGRILKELSSCEAKPEFSIKYKLKDDKKMKHLLLKNAIADAREKAEIIAEAAGVVLGEILRIDYDWSQVRFVNEEYCLGDRICEASPESMDIQPRDIEGSDYVSVVWEIK